MTLDLPRSAYRHGALAVADKSHIPHFHEFITGPIKVKDNSFNWSRNVAGWPDLGNKTIGNCVPVAAMHLTQAVTSYANRMVVATPADGIQALTELNGFDPKAILPDGTNPTDIGVDPVKMLTKWISGGIKMRMDQDHIVAAVQIDPANTEHVKLAGTVFGGVIFVADLPIAAQQPDEPWDGVNGDLIGMYKPGGWARHCMYLPVFDDDGGTAITWGDGQPLDQQWWLDYSTDCFAVMHPAWYASGKCVSGYNYDAAINVAGQVRKGGK